MDYLDYNSQEKSKISTYHNNIMFNDIKNNYMENNAINQYLIQDSNNNKRTYNQNNQFFHEISQTNNNKYPIKENPKTTKFLTEYYSYPFKNMKNKNIIKNKDTNIKNNNILLQNQYSINQNLKNKYANYSPEKRNTFDYKGKNELFEQNKIKSNKTQINISENNNYTMNQNKIIKNNNQYEKALLLNKLNASKSTYNFGKEDILIEYDNVPVIASKNNYNKSYLINNSTKGNYHLFKKGNLTNTNYINNFSYENMFNNSLMENTNNLKKTSYNSNINNDKEYLGKSYFDADVSNIEENYNFANYKNTNNNDYFAKNKKWQFSRHKNYHNNPNNINNNINLNNAYFLREASENYQTNNNIFDITDNNNNMNISKAKIKEKIYKIQKANTEFFKYKNQFNKNTTNNIATNNNKSNYLNNYKNEKNNNNLNVKQIKNYINKSKKDIFQNKEYNNIINLGNHKIKKRISPEPKNKIYSNNEYYKNINHPITSKNYVNNNNIIFHEINDKKPINNKRNNNIQNNLYKYNLLTDKNIDNYVAKDNKNISYINYDMNEDSIIKQPNMENKKSNYQSQKNKKVIGNYIDLKNNTTRYDNSKLEAQKLILLSESSSKKDFDKNIYGYKSTKNISFLQKGNNNVNNNNNNQFSQKGKDNLSPDSYIVQMNNSKNNNMNINLEGYNNLRESNDYNFNAKTESNIQNINRKENNKYTIMNKNKILNENSFSIMKSSNVNKINNNQPVKLYLKKKEMLKNKDIINQYNENKENNKNNNIHNKHNQMKQINYMNNNKTNININNNIDSKNNNNIININNTTSNVNILNVKKSSINICIDQKDNYNLIYPSKNINIGNFYNKGMKNNIKNNDKSNIKIIKNELFEKNKNFKNIKFNTSVINRNNNNSNSNLSNFPSYIQVSANNMKNKDNINIKTDNNTRSYKNILYKGISSETNRNIKQMILNNSSQLLFNDKKLETDYVNDGKSNKKIKMNFFRDYVITEKNTLNNPNENKTFFEKHLRNSRNSNLSKDNINLYNPQKSPTLDNNFNCINLNERKNIPLTPNLAHGHSKKVKSNQNNSGIYVKPCGIVSKSKSKSKKCKKAKSVLRIYKNNNSERNTNGRNIIKRNQSNFDYYFKTSPLFYQKDDYFQSEFGSIKKGSTSLNTSHVTKFENSSLKTKENELSFDNNITIINFIREPYKKDYFFAKKIYKYHIKSPKIEQCFFSKNNIFKKEEIKLLLEQNTNKSNDLRITFGNLNQNSNENNKFLVDDKNEIINIVNFNYNDIEESDLDIYKELQKKMKNEPEEIQNPENILPLNKEVIIYETIQKLKALNKNYNKNKINSTQEGISKEENDGSKINENSLKYKNIENGIKILNNLVVKKDLKNNVESLIKNLNKGKNDKKGDKIFLGTNKLNDIFNNRKETNYVKKDKSSDNIVYIKHKGKNKCSKSVNKDIIKGISKIQNVFGKNNINIISNNSNDENKINNIEIEFEYTQEQKQKIKTYIPRKKNEFDIFNDKIDVNSDIQEKKIKEKKDKSKYKENQININQDSNNIKNNNINIPLKYNEDLIHYRETITDNDEEIIYYNKNNNINSNNNSFEIKNGSHNNSNNSEDFDNYLKIIKKNKSNNILKQDITFLLNIISVGNYSFVLKKLTQIILYKITESKEKNTSFNKSLKNNDDIIYNEHLLSSIIFKHATKGKKYICIYSKLCSDLNKNILNDLEEQKNRKNNKERNLKLIINDECIKIINNFQFDEINIVNNKDNNEFYYFREKIIGFINFVYELINVELLKQQFGFYVVEQFYKLFIRENKENMKYNDIITNIYLEGIITLIPKLGKIIFEKDNQKLLQNINNFIQQNIYSMINIRNQINMNIPDNLKYRIMNIISKKENQWKDTFYEIYEIEQKIKINPETRSILSNYLTNNEKLIQNNRAKAQDINQINKTLIEEDILNYISYFTEENNKGKINIKTEVDKSYNWKVIDELVNNKNFGLGSLINYFISICSSFNYDENKIILCNEYIKNIIEFYANNLSKKAIESLQNEMIKTFSKIDDIVESNKEMYKILGNLLLILIDNKLFHIKFFNNYLKEDKKTQINLAIITKYCIISSGKFAKKYLNDFKQTKLFFNNEIFEKYVIENMKDLFYFIK